AGERVAGMDKPEFWLGAGEAPGILNWALEGMRQLRENGMRFVEPTVCRAALQEHRVDSDPARAFLEEHYVADHEAMPLRTADLYTHYTGWCQANGYKTGSANTFSRQVRRVFGLKVTRPCRFPEGVAKAWYGISPQKPEL